MTQSTKLFMALTLFFASELPAAAQSIMQPSLGGTFSYGPEQKSEIAPPDKQKQKRMLHRRAGRNEKGMRQPAPR